MSVDNFLQTLALASIGDWFTTFSLIFGGCCSNALSLELITTQYPPAGTLITFTQFLLVTLASLRNQLVFNPTPVTSHTAVQNIVNRLEDLQRRTPQSHRLRVLLRGPQERVLELKSALSESRPQLFVDRNKNATVTHEANDSTAENVDVIGNVELCDCATTCERHVKHDFTITLHSGTDSGQELDRFKDAITLDITNPAQPIFAYPLPSLSRRFLHFYRYRLKPRNIPLARYAIQVTLFVVINLLNNAAFAYSVPMAVHIIFRSGGLVVNMLLGWLFYKRRYSRTQVFSIILVTFGVTLTTMSSTQSRRPHSPTPQAYESSQSFMASYATGIALLTLALILSGLLGHQQDACFAKYGRSHWKEALFYLHALALPLFGFAAPKMANEIRAVSSRDNQWIQLQISPTLSSFSPIPLPILDYKSPTPLRLALSIPVFYIPLLINAVTQLICVAGVNRLTARVSSLTVTLVLVVRKAVSLAISVTLFNKESGKGKSGLMLWTGALAVLVGTVLYTTGSKKTWKETDEKKKE